MTNLPAGLVWILLAAFWSPGNPAPKITTDTFATLEQCDAVATELDSQWQAAVKGGSTSWMCTGAFPAPTT